MFFTIKMPSPLGELFITDTGGLISSVSLQCHSDSFESSPVLEMARQQLTEYFCKKRKKFDLPLLLNGTPFYNEVWQELCKIPYGKTCTYGEIAAKVNRPKASRAVGMANHNNPIMIIVPCHRVIGANGRLTGYAGGLHIKEKLLNLETSRDF